MQNDLCDSIQKSVVIVSRPKVLPHARAPQRKSAKIQSAKNAVKLTVEYAQRVIRQSEASRYLPDVNPAQAFSVGQSVTNLMNFAYPAGGLRICSKVRPGLPERSISDVPRQQDGHGGVRIDQTLLNLPLCPPIASMYSRCAWCTLSVTRPLHWALPPLYRGALTGHIGARAREQAKPRSEAC